MAHSTHRKLSNYISAGRFPQAMVNVPMLSERTLRRDIASTAGSDIQVCANLTRYFTASGGSSPGINLSLIGGVTSFQGYYAYYLDILK